jgi:hypothetical protein
MTMNSKRTLIVLIHCGHPNDYEVAKPKRRSLAEFGFSMVDLSINDPGVVGKLNALLTERRSEIFCFLSDNYYGAGIRAGEQLLHRLTGIPIVFFLHDHPLYFLGHQSPALEGGIVFAPGPDLLDFVAKYYPADTLGVVNSAFSLPPYALGEPRYEEFVSRKNMLLCPMNLAVGGLTLDGLWRQLKELPSVRRDFALRLTETALTDCLTPLHVHAEALARAAGPGRNELVLSDQLLVLNFIKAWRRNAMVRELIDLPILVSSEYVPADLELKYPQKFTLFTMEQTTPLYPQYRFVLNSFPLLTSALHERVINGLYGNSVLVTDPNVTMTEHFADGRDLVFLEYEKPGMAQKIARYIDDPQAAFALTRANYEQRKRGKWFSIDSYRDLIQAVELRWAQNAAPAAIGA